MQKSKPSKGQAEKLKQLELSGLVDFDKSHARYFTFVAIMSTGDNAKPFFPRMQSVMGLELHTYIVVHMSTSI